MKIYSAATKGVGVWSLNRRGAQTSALGYHHGRKVHTATLSGTVYVVPPDARDVLPSKVFNDLNLAGGRNSVKAIRKSGFFDGYSAIVDARPHRRSAMVFVLDPDALFNVK